MKSESLKITVLLTVFAAMALTACTANTDRCDPTGDPSMLLKFSCIVSGSYDQRLEDKQTQIKLKRLTLQNLLASQQSLENDRALAQGQLYDKTKTLDELESSIEALRLELNADKKNSVKLSQKLESVQSSIDAMKAGDQDLSVLERQAAYNKLKKEYDDLMGALIQ